jgi:hypothetical protein
VTRDAFEIPRRPGISLEAYFARSSLASACSDRPVTGVDTGTIESAFQRLTVGHDLDKKFLTYVETDVFDLLVHDPIDERFALLTSDGAVATRSNEFLRASYEEDAFSIVESASAEFFALWEHGWTRFLASLDSHGKRGALRINQVYWAVEALGDVDLASVASARQTKAANLFLQRLYCRMREDLEPRQFYTYDPRLLVAAAEHKWGLSPFHYVPEFYEAFVAQLEQEPHGLA